MLENAWEGHASTLANASNTSAFIEAVKHLVKVAKIDLNKPSKVVYARDTRPSGTALVRAFEDGLNAIGAQGRNAGVTTTPVLHYLVRAINTKGTKDEYGPDSEEGYVEKTTTAFKKLIVSLYTPFRENHSSFNMLQAGKAAIPPLLVDCANGVGALALQNIIPALGESLTLTPINDAISTAGALNNACGADYVKTQQKLPPSLESHLHPGQRGCSFDGDADRLMYYYLDEKRQFQMLDGDKIASLVAAFIVELVKSAGLEGKVKVGVVQTAYANGASTKYLSQVNDPSEFEDSLSDSVQAFAS